MATHRARPWPARPLRRGRLLPAAAGAVGSLVLVACGTSGPAVPTTGIDRLEVPTPSPRPADFVSGIDNTWLSWVPGESTTFDTPDGPVVQQVAATTSEVAGLAATAVTTTAAGTSTTDLYAQDDAGNVWWLGRSGEWTAGQDGAEAGLWMPAAPRRGDGFRTGLAPGVSEDVAEVVLAPPADAGSAYDEANLEDGSDADEVRLRVRSDLDPSRVATSTYVEGTGLTSYAVSGTTDDTVWVRRDP